MLSVCPHCGAERSRAIRRLLSCGGALGGGALAFTLMACYGMPPCDGGGYDCHRDDPHDASAAADAKSDAEVDEDAPDGSTTPDAGTDGAPDGGDAADASGDGG